jgi:hypothetical protein
MYIGMTSTEWYCNLSDREREQYYADMLSIYKGTMFGYLIEQHYPYKDSPYNEIYTKNLYIIAHNRDVNNSNIADVVRNVMSDIIEFKFTNLADFYNNILKPYTPPEPVPYQPMIDAVYQPDLPQQIEPIQHISLPPLNLTIDLEL